MLPSLSLVRIFQRASLLLSHASNSSWEAWFVNNVYLCCHFVSLFFLVEWACILTPFFRSIFIWKPQENIEIKQQRDESRIILCGKGEKARKGKFEDDSGDDFDDDKKSSKSSKTKKPNLKLKVHDSKRKRWFWDRKLWKDGWILILSCE